MRRLLERVGDVRGLDVASVMTHGPLTISPDSLAAEAAQLMDNRKKNVLLAVDDAGQLVGALSMPDLLSAKVI